MAHPHPAQRFPQAALRADLPSKARPLCASIRIVARWTPVQTSVLFCSSPFLPPFIASTNFETGASGTDSKVVLIPPFTASIRASRDDADLPVQVSDQVWQVVREAA